MTITEQDRPPQALGAAAKSVILEIIANTSDRSEKKERIMIAWEEGVIKWHEAVELIARHGLKHA